MNQSMIRRLAEHSSARHVEVNPNDYNQPTNITRRILDISWPARTHFSVQK